MAQRDFKILESLKDSKNLILQGAPGTGKTYITRKLVVCLCDNLDETGYNNKYVLSNGDVNRKELIKRYNELVSNNRIAFTTFHQSLDYEDFVEGLKPDLNTNGKGTGTYSPHDGIFKKICTEAKKQEQIIFSFKISNVLGIIKDTILSDIRQAGPTGISFLGRQKEYNFTYNTNVYRANKTKFNPELKPKRLQLVEVFKSGIKNDKFSFQLALDNNDELTIQGTYSAWWAMVNEIGNRYNVLIDALKALSVTEEDKKKYNITESTDSTKTDASTITSSEIKNDDITINAIQQPYILIIDEINRANISKVLGELITLIEPSKRLGEDDEYTVTLPYSGHNFGVPNNLYILGTMNTADRSLGSIDYAIRRRFAFETLCADDSILNGNAKTIYANVKQLIEDTKDEDFELDEIMVGHSYFMGDINKNLEKKIIPLLLEYFKDGVLIESKIADLFKPEEKKAVSLKKYLEKTK